MFVLIVNAEELLQLKTEDSAVFSKAYFCVLDLEMTGQYARRNTAKVMYFKVKTLTIV